MAGKGKGYWRIEIEIEIEIDDDGGYEFTIEETSLLDADFDEWLESLPDEKVEEDGDGDGDGSGLGDLLPPFDE